MKTAAAALLLFALAAPLALAAPPEISNVAASQRDGTKLVDITYDAADPDGDLLTIRIEVSDNDGRTYSVPAFALTGDIGEGVVPGTGKHIVWDAGTDWDGEYSDLMRVMVFAVDAQGYPGMEWGSEVPPGGFLLGQDGGAEGSGPSRHVNIPWSYWLSKYEVTAQQYCDFLNTAYAAGKVAVCNFTNACTTVDTFTNFTGTYILCNLGDSRKIRWNVSHFEVVSNLALYPADVTWFGAMAFAQYYGYDLPTVAEWEKAARGPDFGAQGNHCLYTWGNDKSDAKANFSYEETDFATQRPVGYYNGNQTPIGPDMSNGYDCYDMTGNASEWTRTIASNYPTYMTSATNTNASTRKSSVASHSSESGGTLAAKCLSASGTVKYIPIVPGSVCIQIGADVSLADDGTGALCGTGGSGTVSYTSGTWSFMLVNSQWSELARKITISYASDENAYPIIDGGMEYYLPQEDLDAKLNQYWQMPIRFFRKSGSPIFSHDFEHEGASSLYQHAGFRVIRRYIPDDPAD